MEEAKLKAVGKLPKNSYNSNWKPQADFSHKKKKNL